MDRFIIKKDDLPKPRAPVKPTKKHKLKTKYNRKNKHKKGKDE